MNVGELKLLFKAELPANPATDTEILLWFNNACLDMVRQTHCLRSSGTTSTVASQQEYSLPTDCMLIDPTGGICWKNSSGNWKRLEATSMSWLDQNVSDWRNASANDPKGYYKKGQIIGLYPKPNSDGTDDIKIYYIDKPNTLSGNTDTPLEKDDSLENYHSTIVEYAKWKCKEKIGKYSQGREHRKMYLGSTDEDSDYYGGVACLKRDAEFHPDNTQVIRPYNKVRVSNALTKSSLA